MKKYIYYGTCNAGTQEIVKNIITEKIPDVRDVVLYEGAVQFSSDFPFERIHVNCFNNLFYVLDTYRSAGQTNIINKHITKVLKNKQRINFSFLRTGNKESFRIMISRENQFISITPREKVSLETFISASTGFGVDRDGDGKEFWFLSRNEGVCYFLFRLTKHMAYEKRLHKGELHPEISYMMGWLAHIKRDGMVLDPFCGYGAIPYQVIKNYPIKGMIASDIDKAMVSFAQDKLTKKMREKCRFCTCDVMHLESICEKESIDVIVTDPPWGFYEKIDDIEVFYAKMLDRFDYVMKNGAVAVILTAKKTEFTNALSQAKTFKVLKRYDILVSGKKSAIFTVTKNQ